jgi:oleate hydratase
MKTSSKSRLVLDGHRQDAPQLGLCEKDILTIERLAIEPEAMLGQRSIADQFDPALFKTNFWLMWFDPPRALQGVHGIARPAFVTARSRRNK